MPDAPQIPGREALAPILEAAGAEALRLGPRAPRRKPDGSWVTDADLAVAELLSAACRELLPEAAVLEEERGGRLGAGLCWAIDPIDGTSAFVRGEARWCVSVALLERGRPVLGGIVQPSTGWMWTADATGVTLPKARAPARAVATGRLPMSPRRLLRVARWAVGRRLDLGGSAALALADVATGSRSAAMIFGGAIWDVGAGWALVEAAGGRVEAVSLSGHRFDLRATCR